MPVNVKTKKKYITIHPGQIKLPGFDGVPLSEVLKLIIKGFKKGTFVTRASSIAFNFLLALVPTTVLVFTLIPFIPIPNFQEGIIDLSRNLMPENAFNLFENTIVDVLTNRSGGLMLTMLFATVLSSSNGFHAILHAFSVSEHNFFSRTWLNQRKIAIFLFICVLILIGIAGCLVIFGKMIITRLMDLNIIERDIFGYLYLSIRWVIVIVLLLMAISSIYYFAPAKKKDFRFVSPGSITATLLFIISSLGFSAYVNNIGLYNMLYGWLGTIVVILMWSYLNAIALLIGFELNVSILDAKNIGLYKQNGSE